MKDRVLVLVVLVLIGIGALIIISQTPTQKHMSTNEFSLTSSAFEDDGAIPSEYTCDGSNTNPPLAISGTPEGTVSLALLMDDPDIPQEVKQSRGIESFDHWVLFNISPDTTSIATGEAPGTEGNNSAGNAKYTGPCPPPQYEPKEHRYIFTLYALDTKLDLPEGASRADVAQALEGHVLAETTLVGRYARN